MIQFVTSTKDTRIKDVDYLIEDVEKLKKLIPYLKRKVDGDWEIALFEPPIVVVREVLDALSIPEYVSLTVYVEQSVSAQLQAERPKIFVKRKSAYETYLDMVSEMKVMIEPRASKELYRRVGSSKSKLPEYLALLSESATTGVITLADVKTTVADERRTFASEVLLAFLTKDRSRWKKYNVLLQDLGRDYAFYALRKFAGLLLVDKNKYLRNQDTNIREISKIDTFKINQVYTLFNLGTPSELDMCMYILDNREIMKEVLYDCFE